MRSDAFARLRAAAQLFASSFVLALAPPAIAQVDEGFNAQNFQPPIDGFGYVTMNGARTLRAGHPFFGGYIDWANNPLDLRDIREGHIDEMTFVHAVASIGLVDIGDHGGWSIGAVVPYALWMDGFGRDPRTGDPATAIPPRVELPDGRLADIRAETKITVLDREHDPLGLAFRGWGVIPTGEDKYFLSNDERFGAGLGIILEKEWNGEEEDDEDGWDGFRIGAQVDYEWIEGDVVISEIKFVEDPVLGLQGSETERLRIDDKLHMRVGLAKEILIDDLWLVAEISHWARATHLYNTSREAPAEIGGAIRFDRHVLVLVGASAGVLEAVGAPDVRAYAALGVRF